MGTDSCVIVPQGVKNAVISLSEVSKEILPTNTVFSVCFSLLAPGNREAGSPAIFFSNAAFRFSSAAASTVNEY